MKLVASELKRPAYWLHEDLSTLEKIRAFERTPIDTHQLPVSVYEFLERSCIYSQEAVALVYFADAAAPDRIVQYTYGQVIERIRQTANLLRSLDVDPDDVVSIIPANTPESLFAIWGAQTAGIANPINWMLEPEAIAQILKACKTKVLIAYSGEAALATWDKVMRVLALSPHVRTVIRYGPDRSGPRPPYVWYIDYEESIGAYASLKLDFERSVQAEEIAAIYPTGGTTGAPKLARHTHRNEVTGAWLSGLVAGIREGDVRLSASPLFHVMAPISGCLSTLGRGGKLVLASAGGWRDPELVKNLWAILNRFQVNYFTLVPTVANQLVQATNSRPDLPALKGVFSGSAALSEHVARSFEQLTGIAIREGYGMTETTAVVTINPRGGKVKVGTIGLPFPYHHFRIVDPDRELGTVDRAVNEAGLLLVSGPLNFPGYLDARSDAGLWVDAHWLDTGDLARIDDEGYIAITGRAKDLIIRGGHNIDPRTVEEVFQSHPEVVEVGVVGRPDVHAGEVPVAYVQLRDGASATASDLLAFASAKVTERAAVPKDCYLLPVLPRSAVGKILKNALRLDATRRAISSALELAGVLKYCSLEPFDRGASGVVCVITVEDRESNGLAVCAALAGFSVKCEFLDGSPTAGVHS
jgi:acyl-CoA synthetase (AMP-forming)/AMP-acid ligase II